jgi:hypothetical protein
VAVVVAKMRASMLRGVELVAADGAPTKTPDTLEKTLAAPEVMVEKPPPTKEVTVEKAPPTSEVMVE